MRRAVAAFTAVLMLLAGATLAACSREEASIVETAFERPVDTAVLDLRLEVRLAGSTTPQTTVSIHGPARGLSGPGLPAFDWQVRANDAGSGRFAGQVVSTGRNVFVRYRGTTYEAGEQLVAQVVRRETAGAPRSLADLRAMGLDLGSWFRDTSARHDAHVDGVPTVRVAGRVDVSAALTDLQKAVRSLPGMGNLHTLTGEGLDALVSDPRFALDAGRDDGKLRRIAVTMGISRAAMGGDEAGVLRLVLTLHDVDRPVTIDAPSSGRPIADLLAKLGG